LAASERKRGDGFGSETWGIFPFSYVACIRANRRQRTAVGISAGVRHYDKPQVKQVEDPEIWESGGPIGFAALGQVTLIAVEA